MTNEFTIFSGTANRDLAEDIASQLGVELGECTIKRFPDSEVLVNINQSVREQEVFIVQPTSPPVDVNLMELLAFADACRRASAKRITAVVPYFGYARSDKRDRGRQTIMSRVVADLMQAVGIDRVITVDLHTPQIEGFFRIPVDSISAVSTLYQALGDRASQEIVVVSPDSGRIPTALHFGQKLGTQVAVMHKQRQSGTETEITHVVGDVKNKTCIIVDDMISTGGTIVNSIEALLEAGARPEITVAATHGLLVKDAREKLSHQNINQLLITDTIPHKHDDWTQLQIVSIAPAIAEVIEKMFK